MKRNTKIIWMVLSVILFIVLSTALFAGDAAKSVIKEDTGNTAWLLVSSALVLLMIPGLAFFYGGMVRSKNILNTLMLSFIALGVITVQWVVVGYGLAFGDDVGHMIGWKWDYLFLQGIGFDQLKGDNLELAFVAFQGMFAVITPALISGALAERVKFGAYIIFILLWTTLVYDPICHWVWGGGWIGDLGVKGALDFAGGTVVHISSGVSALAAILILKKRKGYPEMAIIPNNLNFTLLGAGLLWFGWFGFNAGSALAANSSAALAFMTTFLAPAMGALGWAIAEVWHRGKASALGVASGIVAGLVAITPAAAFVSPFWALVIGFAAGFICYGAIVMKSKLGYDDALDVFGIHGVGGTWGAIATGIFLWEAATRSAMGLKDNEVIKGVIDGSFSQLGVQVIAIAGTMVYAFVMTWIIVKVLDLVIGIRVSDDDEEIGLDQTQHGETGYNI